MEGIVRAVRSGLVWPPFDPGAAARYLDFMPHILHLPCKEEVLDKAPKRSVHQLSLWLSCHTSPSLYVACSWPSVCTNFVEAEFYEVRGSKHPASRRG